MWTSIEHERTKTWLSFIYEPISHVGLKLWPSEKAMGLRYWPLMGPYFNFPRWVFSQYQAEEQNSVEYWGGNSLNKGFLSKTLNESKSNYKNLAFPDGGWEWIIIFSQMFIFQICRDFVFFSLVIRCWCSSLWKKKYNIENLLIWFLPGEENKLFGTSHWIFQQHEQ